jgi:SAM-dependent methyltransferase
MPGEGLTFTAIRYSTSKLTCNWIKSWIKPWTLPVVPGFPPKRSGNSHPCLWYRHVAGDAEPAYQSDSIQYTLAAAEQQPFADNNFDLITVSSGVHWFDIDRFLAEANRLLKPGAWLVLYENHFIAEMVGDESFTNWFPEVYLKKFPSPSPQQRLRHGPVKTCFQKTSFSAKRKGLKMRLPSIRNNWLYILPPRAISLPLWRKARLPMRKWMNGCTRNSAHSSITMIQRGPFTLETG